MAESEAEGLVNFLFYVIIVYPVTNWLLKKYKDSNRGMYLAICFLGLIAAGKTVRCAQKAAAEAMAEAVASTCTRTCLSLAVTHSLSFDSFSPLFFLSPAPVPGGSGPWTELLLGVGRDKDQHVCRD